MTRTVDVPMSVSLVLLVMVRWVNVEIEVVLLHQEVP